MKISRCPGTRALRPLIVAALICGGLTSQVHAQSDAARITGRVFNPATREYVRNAQVRIEGTERIVETESDGSFRFENATPGETTLTVTYTGYTATPDRFTLAPGQTAVRELALVSTLTF